jgi:hypothetical protein
MEANLFRKIVTSDEHWLAFELQQATKWSTSHEDNAINNEVADRQEKVHASGDMGNRHFSRCRFDEIATQF